MGEAIRRRAERVEARVTLEQKQLFERAAALEGRSLTDFVVTSAQSAATDTIARHELLQLSTRDQTIFVRALLKPPVPNKALREAAAKYRVERKL